MPPGWRALVAGMHIAIQRDFPDVRVTELSSARGWLHVRVADRSLDHGARTRLDRLLQRYVTQSLSTCMCCGSGHGRDRVHRNQVTCDACETECCDAA
jgi:hypothetical protein